MLSHQNLNVLDEDNHLIAVFKPARLLTQGDRTGNRALMDITKSYLKQKYQKEGQVFLGLLHRLDRPARGVVLFAKTSKGASRLCEQFRSGNIQKTYRVLVQGRLEKKSGRLLSTVDGKLARLEYRLLEEGKRTSLVEVVLHTGRKHQIRKQFAEIGHPVVGDHRYGSDIFFEKGAIALCSRVVGFDHPTKKGERVLVEWKGENWKSSLC